MNKKVLIVGGVAGGASAAARLRRLDEEAQIILFERDPYISFANCGLPYYIGNSIKDREKLIVQTPEAMSKRFNIDVRIESEVIGIDPAQKSVQVQSKERGLYEESYDYLILSPGAKPLRPPIPGVDGPNIYTLRNIPDTDRIKARVADAGLRSAIVIGGGFIGVEMAENLNEIGLDVSLVEAVPQILAPFDLEMAGILAKELEEHGVKLFLSDSVQGFQELDNQVEVQLASGTLLQADIVILAIGVKPDTAFLQGSGLEFGPRGHIIVNQKLETNLENVYAVGDAIEVVDYVNGQKTAIPLAGPANKQGRIAAENVCGLNRTFAGTQGTSIIKVFGLTGASTGNNEKVLQRAGIPYKVIYVHSSSHASYYPGATEMTIKLIFDEQGTVMGAQAVGYEGVDKRIDDIATVIHFRGTVEDLTELELAYAPPFSSAKDPVNMAGFTAENVLTGKAEVFVPADLVKQDLTKIQLIDVRSETEYLNGSIPGSTLIPVDELRNRMNELDPSREVWVYCRIGLRGYIAARILSQNGFKVKNMTGGYKLYQMTQYQPGKINRQTPASSEAKSQAGGKEAGKDPEEIHVDVTVDACGLCCPGPLMQVKKNMDFLQEGQVLKISASDPGFYEDVRSWTQMAGQELLDVSKRPNGIIEALIRKLPEKKTECMTGISTANKEGTTMIVFSGDLDKAIASFIIANGAAASGKKVTMFFTFWGLNILRQEEKVLVRKDLISKMFGAMMPRGSKKLALSKMNMLGMGAKMIRGVMKRQNVFSLEQLIEEAMQQGVEIVACQMSMDVMGIKQEELIDGVKIGGVGYMLGKADQSGINFFI